jgi:hypothetical protein
MNVIDKPIASLSAIASSYVQDRAYKKSYDAQMSELSWFEKNIYLNSAKEKQLQDARTKKAQQDDLLLQGLIIAGTVALKYGLPYFADKRRKTKFAETSCQILSYVATTNNGISECDQTIIRSAMLSMHKSGFISDKKRKQIPSNKAPTSLHEINNCDSILEFKGFIGSNTYKILQNKGYSNRDILNNRRAIFEIIGFESHSELKDFIYDAHDDYCKLQKQNSGFQGIIQSIAYDAANAFNRSKENCIQNSILLNVHDPFKETRQKNMTIIKKGGQIASEIAIGTAQGGHPAAITAYTLSKHLLVDKKDKNANEIFQAAYEKSLVKKGVDKKEVIDFIKQGEALYKSVL